ncbi:MAG: hypothetical protein ABIT36_05590 [Steroidobacteraceae bacterium]
MKAAIIAVRTEAMTDPTVPRLARRLASLKKTGQRETRQVWRQKTRERQNALAVVTLFIG